jgi:hypothetical protein
MRSFAILCLVLLTSCGADVPPGTSNGLPTIPPTAHIECGALLDEGLCRMAVQVAITVQRNPPPIVDARVRRPAVGDDCLTQPHPCDASSIIVTLQSGDTLQDVPLARTATGWVPLELVR